MKQPSLRYILTHAWDVYIEVDPSRYRATIYDQINIYKPLETITKLNATCPKMIYLLNTLWLIQIPIEVGWPGKVSKMTRTLYDQIQTEINNKHLIQIQ